MSKRQKALPGIARLRDLFKYNPDTGVLSRKASGRATGTLLATGYLSTFADGKTYSAHRICWALAYGEDPGNLEIDHINGVRSDNRLANLRAVTSSQNNYNRGMSARNRSGVKGVCWEASRGAWRVTIMADGHLHFLGRFAEIEDAKAAIAAKRQEIHGQFAHDGTARAA